MPATEDVKAAMGAAVDRLAELQEMVGDQNLTADARRAAAMEIITLIGTSEQIVPNTNDPLDAQEIADEDPDVLKLMAPLSEADQKSLAGMEVFLRYLGPRPLVEARQIVGYRRQIQGALARVVNDKLPEGDRLASVRLVLSALERLDELEVNPEDSIFRRIGTRSAETLLATARMVENPKRAWDVW